MTQDIDSGPNPLGATLHQEAGRPAASGGPGVITDLARSDGSRKRYVPTTSGPAAGTEAQE